MAAKKTATKASTTTRRAAPAAASSRSQGYTESDSADAAPARSTSARGMASSAAGSAPKSAFMEWASNPTVRYIAGGIATAVLTRIASNIATKYPEISTFLKENMDTVESKLGEFKSGLGESQDVQH
jgi:hypothetical protein